MRNFKKGFTVPPLLVIILFLLIGGIYVYKSKKNQVSKTDLEVSDITLSNSNASPSQLEVKVPQGKQAVSNNTTVTFEGPGGLSLKIPKDFAKYLSGETKVNGTMLQLGLVGDKGSAYFKDNNLYPNGAEYYIYIAEQKNDDSSYCNETFYHITSKKTYLINGYSFTEINDDDWDDGTYTIILFGVTSKNICRYIRLTTESVTENYLRMLATENPDTDQKQIELMIKNTKVSREYFNKLSAEIVKTISVK